MSYLHLPTAIFKDIAYFIGSNIITVSMKIIFTNMQGGE